MPLYDDPNDVERGCNCLHPLHGGRRCGRPTRTGRGKCDNCKRKNHLLQTPAAGTSEIAAAPMTLATDLPPWATPDGYV